nr:SIN3-HDAC complex-associated factor-like [Leptinotarsa decemlineata]
MHLWNPKEFSDEEGSSEEDSVDKRTEKEKYIFVDIDSDQSESSEQWLELVDVDSLTDDSTSRYTSRTVSPVSKFAGQDVEKFEGKITEKSLLERENNILHISDFVDLSYWKEEKICCGTIYRGLYDEIMVDPRFVKACPDRMSKLAKRNSNSQELEEPVNKQN